MSLEHILLGLLQKPASGYDLKATFDNAIRYFWSAELSQIYTTLKRLEREGAVSSDTVPSVKGPDRKVYKVTPQGRKRFRTWLLEEPQIGEMRLSYIAQIYFMAGAKDLSRTLWFVTDMRKTIFERLRTFRQIEAEWREGYPDGLNTARDDDFHEYLALCSGILSMEARLHWCDEAIELVNERMKSQRPNMKSQEKRKTR